MVILEHVEAFFFFFTSFFKLFNSVYRELLVVVLEYWFVVLEVGEEGYKRRVCQEEDQNVCRDSLKDGVDELCAWNLASIGNDDSSHACILNELWIGANLIDS